MLSHWTEWLVSISVLGQSTVVVSGNSLQNELEPVNDEMKIISLSRFNNYIL